MTFVRLARLCAVAALAVGLASPAGAASTQREDFEGGAYTAGHSLTSDGWSPDAAGSVTSPLITVSAPAYPALNPGAKVARFSTDSRQQRILKIFNNPGFSGTDEVYYSAWMLGRSATGDPNTGSIGVALTSGGTFGSNTGPQFGINKASGTFFLRISSFGATYNSTRPESQPNSDHWYDVRLVIKQQPDCTQTTGTIYTRDITGGETDYHPQDGLTNINLGFFPNLRTPSLFDTWMPYGSSGGQIDNLVMGSAPEAQLRQQAQLLLDFENTTLGNPLSNEGWANGSAFLIQAPVGSAYNTSNKAVRVNTGFSTLYTTRAFSASQGFQDGEEVWYSAWMCPSTSGANTGGPLIGLSNGATMGTSTGPFFGIVPNTHKFYLRASSFGTTTQETGNSATADHWFEVRLVVRQTIPVTGSTGTLYIRDLTAGQAKFTAVPGLVNLPLSFASGLRTPALFNTWIIGGAVGGQVDNLACGRTAGARLRAEGNFVEDSETATVGQNSSTLSWTDVSPAPGATALFTFAAPTGSETNTSGKAIGVNTGATVASIQKNFGSAPFTDSDASVWYSAWMLAQTGTGGHYGGPFAGVRTGSGGIQFGIEPDTRKFFVRPVGAASATLSSQLATADDWYDLRLVITQNATQPNLSTGTLYIRDLSGGDTILTPVTGLTGLSLGFSATNKPATFTSWWAGGAQGGQIDNLSYGRSQSLTGDVSTHGEIATYTPSDSVTMTFTAKGLHPNDTSLKLYYTVVDEFGATVQNETAVSVSASATGGWTSAAQAMPHSRKGFYRVYARLSNGVSALTGLGSRPDGYLTYAVVVDPTSRTLYNEFDSRFGMQGGFNDAVPMASYLGVRWVNDGYDWKRKEPTGPVIPFPPTAALTFKYPYSATNWAFYTLPTLMITPSWAVVPGTLGTTAGKLTTTGSGGLPSGEQGCTDFVTRAVNAYKAAYPGRSQRIYQVTWEPVYPWGFGGTNNDLVRIHQLVYAAVHAADPTALVFGPTGDTVSTNDINWNKELLNPTIAGNNSIAPYLDGFSIHPYMTSANPGDDVVRNGCVNLKTAINTAKGHSIPMIGTEQGFSTPADPGLELDTGSRTIRQHLIMIGEGYRINYAFYAADFPDASSPKGGYGYYYNLQPGVTFGANKVSPKPVAPAFAACTWFIDGLTGQGAVADLSGTQMGYVYTRTGKKVTAMWDYGNGSQFNLTVTNPAAQVYDWMGNLITSITPSGSQVTLPLGKQPLYVVE